MSKERSNTNWYEKNAKLLDMDLDDEIKKETFKRKIIIFSFIYIQIETKLKLDLFHEILAVAEQHNL